MRIAIDGTQASGKTTLAIALHEIYPKVPYITEVATEVARQMKATMPNSLRTLSMMSKALPGFPNATFRGRNFCDYSIISLRVSPMRKS